MCVRPFVLYAVFCCKDEERLIVIDLTQTHKLAPLVLFL